MTQGALLARFSRRGSCEGLGKAENALAGRCKSGRRNGGGWGTLNFTAPRCGSPVPLIKSGETDLPGLCCSVVGTGACAELIRERRALCRRVQRRHHALRWPAPERFLGGHSIYRSDAGLSHGTQEMRRT